MNFSLFYFASDAAGPRGDRYRLLLEGTRFADEHGFEAVWLPERHFNPFGGIFPNPAVVAAGLASITRQVRLRAGSVVLPLHHPARIAEEWSVVDNLSGGRVDISAARGWAKSDRILAPPASPPAGTEGDPFYEALDQIRRLWRGEQLSFADASGARSEVAIFPPPLQPELECWLTCAQNPQRFVEAGERGLNILTSLIMMPLERLEVSLAEYREARKRGGHDPATGKVTLMLHTFLDEDAATVRRAVAAPFREYLSMSFDAWAGTSARLGALDERERDTIIDYAQERYYRTSALFGAVETCLPLVRRIQNAGVTEIACLIDFGVDPQTVLASLPMIDKLRRQTREEGATTAHGQAAERTDLLRQLLLKRARQQGAAPPSAATADKPPVQPTPTQRHRASLGQQALWLLQQSLPESAAYNTAVSLRILQPADEAALLRACQHLCDRHPILRTTYEATADGLFQVVHAHRPLAIERLDATGWDGARQMEALRRAYARPFDLARAVARVHVQSLAGGDLLFMLGVHHIARDGISMTILIDDLLALYGAERDGSAPPSPPPGPAFTDYVAEERALLDSPEGEELRRKWRAALAGAPTVLDVPGDRSRPTKLGARGSTVSRALGGDTVAALRAAARAMGVTTNGLLCAVYAVLLQRYSGADDILIGMPAVGRDRARFARTAGYFVNPVPCRATFQPGDAFSDFAARMQAEIARALGAQALPFPEIVRLVDPSRDASRLPLVQFLFGYLRIGPDRPLDMALLPGAEPGPQEVAGLRFEPALVAQEEGQFDGTLEAIERPDSIHLALKYNTDLYSPDFAAQLMDRYVTLLGSAIEAPQAPVEDLDMLSPDERARLSAHRGQTVAIPDLPIEALVRRQMSETPEALAVRDATRSLTFGQLGEEVARLAARLRDRDVTGRVVGIHAEPSVAALVGVLAVLEAGGVFLPLDPANPGDRLAFMVEDSGTTTILTDRPVSWEMPEGARLMALEPGEEVSGEDDREERPTEASATPPGGRDRAAYLVYTSGSTGRPKGVSVGHRSVVNLLFDLRGRMPLAPGEVF
ncbi:MAG: LLM class flavin-dependent oxidoreductase, partial [Chromatiales bacterium]